MRVVGAVIIALIAMGPISAQQRNPSNVGFGNVVLPGLGHAPISGNVWGNVVHPGIPTSFNKGITGTPHRSLSYGAYAVPVYVGGYGYGYGSGYDPSMAASQQQPNVTVVYPPAQQPVVINQYLNGSPSDQGQGTDTASNLRVYQAPSNDD